MYLNNVDHIEKVLDQSNLNVNATADKRHYVLNEGYTCKNCKKSVNKHYVLTFADEVDKLSDEVDKFGSSTRHPRCKLYDQSVARTYVKKFMIKICPKAIATENPADATISKTQLQITPGCLANHRPPCCCWELFVRFHQHTLRILLTNDQVCCLRTLAPWSGKLSLKAVGKILFSVGGWLGKHRGGSVDNSRPFLSMYIFLWKIIQFKPS